MTVCTDVDFRIIVVSTHMPLARHDAADSVAGREPIVSTHMPLARHDPALRPLPVQFRRFYSHASCEA